MPRHARLLINNCPHHIIQRGHNRQVIFARDNDYNYYLETLQEWKSQLGCKLYAYCLMTNHVHLIINPGAQPESLSLLMKRIAGRQTRYINTTKGRSGSLWEGRFKSSPISADEYLLACCRYVELNPVRAGMVAEPWQYPWSSCQAKSGLKELAWLDTDPCYMRLGKTPEERSEKYQKWLTGMIPEGEWKLIREASQRGQLTGSRNFVQEISRKLGRTIELRGQGRPKKEK